MLGEHEVATLPRAAVASSIPSVVADGSGLQKRRWTSSDAQPFKSGSGYTSFPLPIA